MEKVYPVYLIDCFSLSLLLKCTLNQFVYIIIKGISQLALIISELQRLSTLYHCTILVTNHARSQFINFLNKQQFNRNSCSLPPTSIGCLGINWSLIPNHRVLFECLTPWTNSLSCKIKVQLVNNNLHKINKQTNHCNKHQCNSETVWEFTV